MHLFRKNHPKGRQNHCRFLKGEAFLLTWRRRRVTFRTKKKRQKPVETGTRKCMVIAVLFCLGFKGNHVYAHNYPYALRARKMCFQKKSFLLRGKPRVAWREKAFLENEIRKMNGRALAFSEKWKRKRDDVQHKKVTWEPPTSTFPPRGLCSGNAERAVCVWQTTTQCLWMMVIRAPYKRWVWMIKGYCCIIKILYSSFLAHYNNE